MWKISSPPKRNWILSKRRLRSFSLFLALLTCFGGIARYLSLMVHDDEGWLECNKCGVKSERNSNLLFWFSIALDKSLVDCCSLLCADLEYPRSRHHRNRRCRSSWSSTLLRTPTNFLLRSPSSSTLSNQAIHDNSQHTREASLTCAKADRPTTISRNSKNAESSRSGHKVRTSFTLSRLFPAEESIFTLRPQKTKEREIHSDFVTDCAVCLPRLISRLNPVNFSMLSQLVGFFRKKKELHVRLCTKIGSFQCNK